MFQFKNVKLKFDGNLKDENEDREIDSHTIHYFQNKHNHGEYIRHYSDILEDDLENMINNIISDSYGNRNIPLPTKSIPEGAVTIKHTEEYNDENRPLKDIMTDFVTKILFSTERSLFNFIYIITDMFNDALNIYKRKKSLKEYDVFFILKGGNVLRMIAKNFLFDLPGDTINILLD